MEEQPTNDPPELAAKIARLVEERGWNQEEFARIARVNRHTARQILLRVGGRSLRNSTILACARRWVCRSTTCAACRWRSCCRSCATPSRPTARLACAASTNRRRSRSWSPGWNATPTGRAASRPRNATSCWPCKARPGRSSTFGVEGFVQRLERRRRIVERIHAIAGTEYLDLLEQFVDLLHDRVQPGRDRP